MSIFASWAPVIFVVKISSIGNHLQAVFLPSMSFIFPIVLLESSMLTGECIMRHDVGGALPAFAQLAVSTYHTATASSHATISQITMQVEERGTNTLSHLKDSSPSPTSPQSSIGQKSWSNWSLATVSKSDSALSNNSLRLALSARNETSCRCSCIISINESSSKEFEMPGTCFESITSLTIKVCSWSQAVTNEGQADSHLW